MTDSPEIPRRFPATAPEKLMYFCKDKLHDGQMRFILTFNDRIDMNRLVRAVRLTLDAEPILGCRFVAKTGQPFWERRNDLDEVILCRLQEKKAGPEDVNTCMGTPMDPTVDPLVQLCLFRSTHDTLVIKLSHIVADAGGMFVYTRLLAKTYTALIENPDYIPEPNVRGERSIRPILKHVGYNRILKSWRRLSLPNSPWGIPESLKDEKVCGYALRRVDSQNFYHLKSYGRTYDASLTEILLSAYSRALFALFDIPEKEPLQVEISRDLRQYLPDGRGNTISILSSTFYQSIKGSRDFNTALKDVQKNLQQARKNESWLAWLPFLALLSRINFIFISRIGRVLVDRGIVGRTIQSFANIGIIDPSEFHFGNAEIDDFIAFGPNKYPPGLTISVYTFRDRMTITASYIRTDVYDEIVSRLLDTLLEELPSNGKPSTP